MSAKPAHSLTIAAAERRPGVNPGRQLDRHSGARQLSLPLYSLCKLGRSSLSHGICSQVGSVGSRFLRLEEQSIGLSVAFLPEALPSYHATGISA